MNHRKKSCLVLLATLAFGACTEVAQPLDVIDLPDEAQNSTGISVNERGVFLLSDWTGGYQEIMHLSHEGELIERIEIAIENEGFGQQFFDFYQIDERNFALAARDEVVRYDSAMNTVEPYYCFVPGPFGLGGDVDPGPDLVVHAVAAQPSAQLFWGTQRLTDFIGGNELRAYRFGETEEPAHVFALDDQVEPAGLVVGQSEGFLVETNGALHILDLDNGDLRASEKILNLQRVDGMDSHEGVLYVYSPLDNQVVMYDAGELLQ